MSITRVYWIIFILSHFWHTCSIGIYIYYIYIRYIIYIIYICIYIYKVIFILFFLSSTVMFFLHCMLKLLRYEKIFFWNWWVDCFIARSIKWYDISGCSWWNHFPFYGLYFFSTKLCFLWSLCLLLIAASINLDTSGKPIVGFFLKITSPS